MATVTIEFPANMDSEEFALIRAMFTSKTQFYLVYKVGQWYVAAPFGSEPGPRLDLRPDEAATFIHNYLQEDFDFPVKIV